MTKTPITAALAAAGFALFCTGASAQVDTSTGTSTPTQPPSEQRPLDSGPAAPRHMNPNTDASANPNADINNRHGNRAGDRQDQRGEQLAQADRDFLENAAQSGLAEVEGSRIALESDASPLVRGFAEKMIEDHTRANEELMKLAERKGFTLPDEPSVAQRAELLALRALSGEPFNRAYAARIGEAAHEDAVELFRRATTETQDPEIRAYAEKMLPKLEEHLKMARDLREKFAQNKLA